MNRYDLERDDPTFVDDLHKSHPAVVRVGEWLSAKGYIVQVPTPEARDKIEDRHNFSDGGDIFIDVANFVRIIEVKQRRNIDFTGLADYPYPTIFIDSVSKYDRKNPKPWLYFIVNRGLTTALVIKGTTPNRWGKTKKYDKQKSRSEAFYVADTSMFVERSISA